MLFDKLVPAAAPKAGASRIRISVNLISIQWQGLTKAEGEDYDVSANQYSHALCKAIPSKSAQVVLIFSEDSVLTLILPGDSFGNERITNLTRI